MDLVNYIFENAEKISVIGILGLAVLGFMRGWIVPGPTHDRVLKERDKYLDAATEGMQLAKMLTERAAVVAVKKDIQ